MPLVTLIKRFLQRAKQKSYLQQDIWGSAAVHLSDRDSPHNHHTPTESWEDSVRPRSEIPQIHRSDRLKKEIEPLSYQVPLGLFSFRAFNSAGTSAELSINYVIQIYRKKKKISMATVDTIKKRYHSVNRIIADQKFKPSGNIVVFAAAAVTILRINIRFLGQSS